MNNFSAHNVAHAEAISEQPTPPLNFEIASARQYFADRHDSLERAPTSLSNGFDACYLPVSPQLALSKQPMRVLNGTTLPLRGDQITFPPHDAQPLYVIGLRHGRLLAPFGMAASADGTLFPESQRDETCLKHFYFDSANLFIEAGCRHHAEQFSAPARFMPGRYVSLLYELGENWYHWLVENLGRVFVAHQIPDQGTLRYIVHPDLTAAQLETLDRLGIGAARRVLYDRTLWQCEELWLPSFPVTRGSIYEPCLRLMAETLVAQNYGAAGTHPRRLYLSRAGAGRRSLENDGEIAAALAPLGFAVADFGTASLSEQIAAFQSADILVAPHGAALSNILFLRPNSFVVELLPRRPSGIVDTIFYGLAVAARWKAAWKSDPASGVNSVQTGPTLRMG